MRKGFWKGTIIVALLLVVGLWAFPSFKQFKCRAKQSEARMGLAQLASAEHFYRNENQSFASLSLIESTSHVTLRKQYYEYSTIKANGKEFELRASGKSGTQVAGDVWSVDQTSQLKHVHDGCTR
jgi:type IV pilus assembly protein PilA